MVATKKPRTQYQQELDSPFTPLLHKPGGNKAGYTPLQDDEQELVPTCPHPGMSPDSSASHHGRHCTTASATAGTHHRQHRKFTKLRVSISHPSMENSRMSETRVHKLEEVGQQLQAQISKIKDFVRDEVGTVFA